MGEITPPRFLTISQALGFLDYLGCAHYFGSKGDVTRAMSAARKYPEKYIAYRAMLRIRGDEAEYEYSEVLAMWRRVHVNAGS